MKQFLTVSLLLSSVSALANFNEVECKGSYEEKSLYLEIEQPFPPSSTFKHTRLTVTENEEHTVYDYTISLTRRAGFNRLQYIGGGLRLEVDTWPDQTPRWGRDYRATLTSPNIGNRSIINLTCQFPNNF